MINEFVEKLRERLGKYEYSHLVEHDTEECLHCRENEDGWCNCRNCFICVWDKAKSIVKELAEEYKDVPDTNVGKWIPVSEHYPDTEKYILLSFSNFPIPVVGRWEEDENGGAFYIGDEQDSCVSQDLYVNAWQPLPEPYKGE